MQNLKSYLEQEHQNKKGKPWDSSGWDFEFFTPVSAAIISERLAYTRKRRNRQTETIVASSVVKHWRRSLVDVI